MQIITQITSIIGSGKTIVNTIESVGALISVRTNYECKGSIIYMGATTEIHVSIKEAEGLIAALQDSNARLLNTTIKDK